MNLIAFSVSVLLLLGNGFFVGAEFSLISSRRTQLEPLAIQGSRRAVVALRAMAAIPLMIAGAQLGVTASFPGSRRSRRAGVGAPVERAFEALGIPSQLVPPLALVIALVFVVFLHTVIGEMVPKNIALAGPEKVVLWLGPPIWWFSQATRPVLVAVKWMARGVLRLWSIESADEVKTIYTADELASLVAESRTEGLLGAEDHRRITGASTLTERTASSVLRTWAQVYTVARDVTPVELERFATRTRHSRFPVVDAQTRAVLGFVHIKEVLGLPDSARRSPLPTTAIRPLSVVESTVSLAELLLLMRRERSHLVLVRDGSIPSGVIALDDVLAAVVSGEFATRSS